MSTLSNNLKYYRSLSGKTVREVSEETGIAHQTYTGWELGNRQPRNLDDLDRVAECFGITKDLLLYDREGNTVVVEFKEKRSEQDAQNLMKAYYELSREGRMKLSEYAEDLLSIDKYRKKDGKQDKG